MASLGAFFDPQCVAVIGASRNPSKVGGSVLANLKAGGFPGRVIPVNARAETVQGLPAAPSILAVDEPVDLAVVAVPAAEVLSVLKECAVRGVGGAIVISAGFRETGGEGAAREAELRQWLRGQTLRVLGPNCLGWIRPGSQLNVTFAPGMPRPGRIAFISHSGALAVAILDWSRERHMGFSLFASLGNQADITETDVLAAVATDAGTQVIVMYVEGVAAGRRFFETLRAASALKPVVLLKAGRSSEGARAVSSHTGALAGSDQAFDAAVRQAGAVRVHTIEELFDLAWLVERQPAPRGRRLLVVTNGGGLGIVATDAARELGLAVPPLDDSVRTALQSVLPRAASVINPVDLVGDADAARFSHALHALRNAGTDAVLVLLTAQAATDSADVARAVIGATRAWTIPVAAALVGGSRVAPGVMALEEAGIPAYPFPERVVTALAQAAMLAERRRARAPAPPERFRPPGVARAAEALRAARARQLGLVELAPVLAAYEIPVARWARAATAGEAAARAAELGFPLAVKIVSADITHKSDVGGVRLGLRTAEEVRRAVDEVLARAHAVKPEARTDGVLLQRMVEGGQELLLGAIRDVQFGPMVVVGFGGVYVEVLKDTAARLAPIEPAEALAMLEELRMAPALRGIRGQPPADRAALAEAISRFSRLAADLDDLAEIELNPLMALTSGVIAVDARAALSIEARDHARG